MPSTNHARALHRANVWIADLGRALETDDRHFTQRLLRVWLHLLRDRLTMEAAVKFGQQLPELLRGEYYDGWEPSRVPVKYDAEDYVRRFATDALVAADEVPALAATTTYVVTEHMSPGQVERTLAELPADLRATMRDAMPVRPGDRGRPDPAKMATLEERVAALGEAVRTLARGLDDNGAIGTGVDRAGVARAARLAEEILVAVGP